MRIGEPPPRGFTLVGLLAVLALLMLGLAQAGTWWSQDTRRDRERELLRTGAVYAAALASYHRRSPGSLKHYPQSLDELLRDPRYIGTVRHLRELYPDPLDPARPWGLVRDERGGIVGVFSRSADAPLLRQPAVAGIVSLPSSSRYDEWKFVALPSGDPP